MAKTKKVSNKKKVKNNSYFIESFWLIAYGYITILTPNLEAFDSNGPKFLSLSILNVFVFIYIMYNKLLKENILLFFKSKIGVAYALLMLFSLFSFTKAININESILHFSKIITVFIATWFVSILVYNNKKALLPLAISMCLLLIIDSLSVFRGVLNLIEKKIDRIELIKSVYSNKNVLTSSLFMKIPFALWLVYFYSKKIRIFAIITLALAVLATLFLSSRTFYLAIFAFSILLIIFSTIFFIKNKEKKQIKNVLLAIGIVLGSVVTFNLVKNNFYTKEQKGELGILERISTILTPDEVSKNLRLKAWQQSFQLIKKEPLLGVGLGNWKIRILEYENKYSKNYLYVHKAHNDFIEITTETGVFGGLSFLAVFVFITWYFARVLLKNPESKYLKWYFLVFFGMVAYFFDAFFNFPQDRAEVQALFALIIGAAIAIRNRDKKEKNVQL